jgi:DNA-binding NtrC family response regulator
MQNEFYSSSLDRVERAVIVGVSPWAKKIRSEILAVSACPSNVLVTGPTGTGKEVIARAIYAHSSRADKPFIPIDCAAIPGALFSSHIFGHLKGAFTGADYSALGCFRAANGGTVFLDEIGELEADMQTKLLRVLQERAVCPVGGYEEISVDIRVIAATNRDLEREVAAGRFREDLYYRLKVVSLRTAPLRERPEDIADLARHILNKLSISYGLPVKHLSEAALMQLQRYDWPGNVRQLENVLERAAFLSPDEAIGVDDVFVGEEAIAASEAIAPQSESLPLVSPATVFAKNHSPKFSKDCSPAAVDIGWSTMAEVEREHIRRTLGFTNGNRSEAAQLLGIERHQLARKVSKYGLEVHAAKRAEASKRTASADFLCHEAD